MAWNTSALDNVDMISFHPGSYWCAMTIRFPTRARRVKLMIYILLSYSRSPPIITTHKFILSDLISNELRERDRERQRQRDRESVIVKIENDLYDDGHSSKTRRDRLIKPRRLGFDCSIMTSASIRRRRRRVVIAIVYRFDAEIGTD